MPDTHMLQVVRFEAATVEGPEGDRDYVKVAGYGPDGTWCKAIMFGASALKVEERLREEFASAPGRQVVLCEGRWRVQGDGAQGLSRAFVAGRMEVVVGPAAEVTLARLDAAKALGRADKLRRMALDSGKPVPEEMLAAYQEMEAFVSAFTGQAPPSLAGDAELADVALVGLDAVPEEAALVRLDALAAVAGTPVPSLRVAKGVDKGPSPAPTPVESPVADVHGTPATTDGTTAGAGADGTGPEPSAIAEGTGPEPSAIAEQTTAPVPASGTASEAVPDVAEGAPSTSVPEDAVPDVAEGAPSTSVSEGAVGEAPVEVAAAVDPAPAPADVPAVRPVPRTAPPRFVPGRRPAPGRPMPAPDAGSSPKM